MPLRRAGAAPRRAPGRAAPAPSAASPSPSPRVRKSRQTPSTLGRPAGEHGVDQRAPRRGPGVGQLQQRAPSGASRARCAAGAESPPSTTATDSKTPSPRPRPWSKAETTGSSAGTRTAAPFRQTATRAVVTAPACPTPGLGSSGWAREHAARTAAPPRAARRAAARPRPAADRRSAQQVLAAVTALEHATPEAIGARLREEAGPGRRRARHVDGLPDPGAARAARPGLAHPSGQGRAGLPRRRAPAPARRLPVLRRDRLGPIRTCSTRPRNVWRPIWVSPSTWVTSPCPERAARAGTAGSEHP